MADVLEVKEVEEVDKVAQEITEEQADLNSFLDLPEETAEAGGEIVPPAEETKEPLEQDAGPGKPVKDESVAKIDFEAEHTKLQDQVSNLNKALKFERDGKKETVSAREQELLNEISDLKLNPASTENEVDPDVEKTVLSIIEKREAAAALKVSNANRTKWDNKASDYVNTLAGEGADEEAIAKAERDFQTVVEGHFTPMAQEDPELAAEFTSSADPAKFAYEKGMEAMKASNVDSDTTIRTDERAKMVKELNALNLGVSLSTLPGSPLQATKPKVASELDIFIDD